MIVKILQQMVVLSLIFLGSASELLSQGFTADQIRYFGDRYPDDLMSVLLSSPDVLVREDIPKFEEWRVSIKSGQDGIVKLKNPAYDNNRFSYWGSFALDGDAAPNYSRTCAEVKTSYHWSLIYSKDIEKLLSLADGIFIDFQNSSPDELKIYIAILSEVLSQLRQTILSFAPHLATVQKSDHPVRISYMWPISKTDFVRSIYPTANPKVKKVVTSEVRYPAQNWSNASGYPISYHDFIVAPLRYESGALRVTVKESLTIFCLNQIYFGMDAIVDSTFEVLDRHGEKQYVESRKTPVRLAGSRLATYADEVAESDEFLLESRRQIKEFDSLRKSTSPPLAQLRLTSERLLGMESECQVALRETSPATYAGCRHLESYKADFESAVFDSLQSAKVKVSITNRSPEEVRIFERLVTAGRFYEALFLADTFN